MGDKTLKLFPHQSSRNARVRVNGFAQLRNNRGPCVRQLGSNGGEELRRIAALALDSFEKKLAHNRRTSANV